MKPGEKIVLDAALVGEDKWSQFVNQHQNGNIFHSPVLVSFYENVPFYMPVTIFYLDTNGEILGLIVSYILRESDGLLGSFSSRAIVWGGPLIKNGHEEILSELLVVLKSCLKRKVSYIQIRNLFSTSEIKNAITSEGFVFEEHLNILFTLKKPLESLWKDVHPTRRKQINRAVKKGVVIKVADKLDSDELQQCYEILEQVYHNAKLPFPEKSFFEKAAGMISGDGEFKAIIAYWNNEIIGFRFFLLFKGLIYDWYAGSNPAHYDKYPNDILPWALIKWGHEHGCHTFDFGGAGNPKRKYGVRDYKLKFGGDTVNFGRYLFVCKPLIYYPAKLAFTILKKK
ncbi:MAG TPA: GNAT family N-acetyltransferase [Bacteroidales bacterium]|nr:GNAT family N-acetyltransferase [Bacteroidales bacterium]HPT11009.1 GNAT family N-acetyltransferase [Bacteroidales bacterium]